MKLRELPTFISTMITEKTIDECIEILATEDTDFVQAMADDQPVLAGYLASEEIEAFTQEEVQYMYYLAVLCWMCFDHTYEELEEVDEDFLSQKEEQNWNRIESLRPNSLKNIIDRWIPEYEEPELLYHLEDALMLDEEDPEHPVTKIGQIPMFVTLLTVVDGLIEARKKMMV